MVDKIDDKTLDVGPILILIGHDHQLAVAKTLDAVVFLAILQTLS